MKTNLIITENQIYDIYKMSYTVSGLRGTKRQKTINQVIIDSLSKKEEYTDCVFKGETNIPSKWGKTKKFKVDICVYKNNQLIEVILLKATSSNKGQNNNNFMTNMSGEVNRVNVSDIKITFINFLPNNTPYFNKKEEIKRIENNNFEFIFIDDCLYNKNVSEIYITFDIENINICSSKKDVEELFIESNPITNVEIHINNYIKPKIQYV
jgi:hypothetical protein